MPHTTTDADQLDKLCPAGCNRCRLCGCCHILKRPSCWGLQLCSWLPVVKVKSH